MRALTVVAALSLAVVSFASWRAMSAGDSPAAPAHAAETPFAVAPLATFDEPWAIAMLPANRGALVTERGGALKLWRPGGQVRDVAGVPPGVHEGQGGLGDVVLAPDFSGSGTIYLSWAEAGPDGAAGAAVGRAVLTGGDTPRLEGLRVIWRQDPKVTGRGHYSHRIAFSPDGRLLFIASGERQKMTPAQDMSGNLGKIVRLLPDGTPAPGNPYAARGGVAAQVWTLGHRNILGLAFDGQGRLWDLEHGPRGGDELNLVEPGSNYGWPVVSEGRHYSGQSIPPHSSRPDFAAPALSWNPVIAPGNFIFCHCERFPAWRGQALVAGLGARGIVRVAIEGTAARELARYDLGKRIRAIAEGADGALYVLEDGGGGRLLRLTARRR